MKLIKAILRHRSAQVWQFCAYLFWPQAGKQRRKMEQLTIIGQEIADGRTEAVSPEYISRMLNVPIEEVEKCMREMEL